MKHTPGITMTQNASRKHSKSAEEKMSWQSKADHGSSSGVAMDVTHSTVQQNLLKLATNYRKNNHMTNNKCFSFADGHNLHYIAINSASRPRVPATIKVFGGAAFQVTVEGKTSLWFTHNPQRLLIALAGAKPENIEATKGRTWLFVKGDYSVECFNMTTRGIAPCVSQSSTVDLSQIKQLVRQMQEEEERQKEGEANV